jgi:hypothetical protein
MEAACYSEILALSYRTINVKTMLLFVWASGRTSWNSGLIRRSSCYLLIGYRTVNGWRSVNRVLVARLF